MIDAGILDGDFIVARVQDTARNGDVVVAGIPGEEGTIKTFFHRGDKVVLEPSNPSLEPHGVRPGGGQRLRQGRDGPAQALSAGDRPRRGLSWRAARR